MANNVRWRERERMSERGTKAQEKRGQGERKLKIKDSLWRSKWDKMLMGRGVVAQMKKKIKETPLCWWLLCVRYAEVEMNASRRWKDLRKTERKSNLMRNFCQFGSFFFEEASWDVGIFRWVWWEPCRCSGITKTFHLKAKITDRRTHNEFSMGRQQPSAWRFIFLKLHKNVKQRCIDNDVCPGAAGQRVPSAERAHFIILNW